MSDLSFVSAHTPGAREALLELDAEYMAWVRQAMAQWLPGAAGGLRPCPDAQVIQALCAARPPEGVGYLLAVDGQAAGMCGLRRIAAQTAEIKRLYIRPAYRDRRFAHLALARLMDDAARCGCPRVCLDTAPFMAAAHRLYEAQGFTDCGPYEGTEVPPALWGQWRFMQRAVPGPVAAPQAPC